MSAVDEIEAKVRQMIRQSMVDAFGVSASQARALADLMERKTSAMMSGPEALREVAQQIDSIKAAIAREH